MAYDHGMEHGTLDFDDETVNPEKIMEIARSGYYTGVILQKGVAEKYYDKVRDRERVPLIVKLNGKTNLLKDKEPCSMQLCSIDEALSLGAQAVGYTVYIGSEHEEKMIAEFARIEEECQKKSLPLIGWMYPRGHAVAGREYDKEILSYAARVGLEVGAEMVKMPYTGDPVSFRWVVSSAGRTKVVVMGGKKMLEKDFFQMVDDVLLVGAIGLAVGRNVWQAENPLEISKKLAEKIYSG